MYELHASFLSKARRTSYDIRTILTVDSRWSRRGRKVFHGVRHTAERLKHSSNVIDRQHVRNRTLRAYNCTRCQQKPQASINCAVCSEGAPKKPSLVVLNCVPTELVFVNVRYSAYVSSTCMFHARMRTVKMLHSKFVYTSSNLYVSRIRFWLV